MFRNACNGENGKNVEKSPEGWRFKLNAESGPLESGHFGEIGDFGQNGKFSKNGELGTNARYIIQTTTASLGN